MPVAFLWKYKTLKDERITIVEGDKVITEEKDVVKIFQDHFEKNCRDS